MRKLYCGGTFDFDYQQADYREQAAADYRVILLGSPERLLQRSDGVKLSTGVEYIGPFYFESDGMMDTNLEPIPGVKVFRNLSAPNLFGTDEREEWYEQYAVAVEILKKRKEVTL